MKNDGKKINDSYENPIDLVLVRLGERLHPTFRKFNLTPNDLTLASLVITLLSFYAYVELKNKVLFVVLYFIGYAFDCFDGNYARSYGMTSDFGDYFDHGADMVKFFVYSYVLFFRTKDTSRRKKLYACSLLVGLLLLATCMGCQEMNSSNNESSSSIAWLENLCLNKDHVSFMRFFGVGSFKLLCAALLLLSKPA